MEEEAEFVEEEAEFVDWVTVEWDRDSLLKTEGRIGRDLMETCHKKPSETMGGSELSLFMELRAQVKCR